MKDKEWECIDYSTKNKGSVDYVCEILYETKQMTSVNGYGWKKTWGSKQVVNKKPSSSELVNCK